MEIQSYEEFSADCKKLIDDHIDHILKEIGCSDNLNHSNIIEHINAQRQKFNIDTILLVIRIATILNKPGALTRSDYDDLVLTSSLLYYEKDIFTEFSLLKIHEYEKYLNDIGYERYELLFYIGNILDLYQEIIQTGTYSEYYIGNQGLIYFDQLIKILFMLCLSEEKFNEFIKEYIERYTKKYNSNICKNIENSVRTYILCRSDRIISKYDNGFVSSLSNKIINYIREVEKNEI